MSESNLDRTFAVMLAELEDAATELTKRLSALHREAAGVEAELQRVEGVRSAMLGKAPRKAREGERTAAQERVRRITEYAKANGGRFTGREVADALGIAFQGAGPVLAGMVRRGEATVEEPEGDGPRVYTIVG